jgi:hypothetical protein
VNLVLHYHTVRIDNVRAYRRASFIALSTVFQLACLDFTKSIMAAAVAASSRDDGGSSAAKVHTADDLFVANPCFPYSYFPRDAKTEPVPVLVVYRVRSVSPDSPIPDADRVTSTDMDVYTRDVRSELALRFMDYGSSHAGWTVTMHEQELHRYYDVINALVRRNVRVYCNDHTQTTWPPLATIARRAGGGGGEANLANHRIHFCASLSSLFKATSAATLASCHILPFHLADFWGPYEDGRRFAEQFRAAMPGLGVRDSAMSLGEYFVTRQKTRLVGVKEDGKDGPAAAAVATPVVVVVEAAAAALGATAATVAATVVAARDEPDLCMICLTNLPDTIVKPCNHCVVCSACSKALRATPDARICVRCRTPITAIE